MNCCEKNAPNGCDQGRTCPVRATRDAGVCSPEIELHGRLAQSIIKNFVYRSAGQHIRAMREKWEKLK